MKQIDLEPGEYQERKPKGWRWRLPWGHPDDNKLPLVMFFVAAGFLVWFFLGRDQMPSDIMFGVAAVFGIGAGGMFQLFMRD